jgi:hypothetical protein
MSNNYDPAWLKARERNQLVRRDTLQAGDGFSDIMGHEYIAQDPHIEAALPIYGAVEKDTERVTCHCACALVLRHV